MPAPGHDLHDRVDALLDVAGKNANVLVCTHDNPDPDAIAAGFALGELLRARAGATYTITHGGVLGRAENRAMVRLLKIPLVPFARVDLSAYDVVALVDTQPAHGNHRVTPAHLQGKRLVCIDHHPAREWDEGAPDFADVGGDYGATSTMLTCYLDSAEVAFDPAVATALFYGIKSDTRDLGREVGRHRLACPRDRLRVRVERENVRGVLGNALRQPAVTAPHLQHPRAAEVGQAAQCRQMGTFRVDHR